RHSLIPAFPWFLPAASTLPCPSALLFHSPPAPRHLPSFPTRRSPDLPVHVLQAETTAAAAVGRVPHNQVGVDHHSGTGSIAESRGAIDVGKGAALGHSSTGGRSTVRGCAHDDESAAVGRNGWVGALVEQDRVVLDITVVAESEVSDTATVTGAHVPAEPVIGESVMVGTDGESYASCSCRSGREQFVANRRVARDRVVVNVDVLVIAIGE